jgi:16S rRNA (cytosine1402-N4)-methyltransferase
VGEGAAGAAHAPVLAAEAVAFLDPAPGKVVLDGTVGQGGHALLIAARGAEVIGIDRDPAAVAAAESRLRAAGARARVVHGNFRDARAILDALGVAAVDGALVDLGFSSAQIDDPARGLAFSRRGPLDMRLDPTRGETAAELIARLDERELADVVYAYGEERASRPIARALKRAQAEGRLAGTAAAAEVIARAARGRRGRIHPATRTFQALRIAVNDELGALDAFLAQLEALLKPGGRAAVIAFHSLEDRRVKLDFRAKVARGWRAITKKAVQASEDEVRENPRARSARLRAVEKPV